MSFPPYNLFSDLLKVPSSPAPSTPSTGNLFSDLIPAVAPQPPQPEAPGFLDTAKSILTNAITPANLVRLGGPIAGGFAGAKAGAAIGAMGGPIGAGVGGLVGGAIGGMAGEVGAEVIEGRQVDPGEVALAGALSAIPAGPAARLAAKPGLNLATRGALHTAEGAAQGVLDTLGTTGYREGRLPSISEAGHGALAGALIGGPLGTGLDVLARRAPQVDQPQVQEQTFQPVPEDFGPPPIWEGGVPPGFMDEPQIPLRSTPEVQADLLGLPPVWEGEQAPIPQGMDLEPPRPMSTFEQLLPAERSFYATQYGPHVGQAGLQAAINERFPTLDAARAEYERITRIEEESKARRRAEEDAKLQKQRDDFARVQAENEAALQRLSTGNLSNTQSTLSSPQFSNAMTLGLSGDQVPVVEVTGATHPLPVAGSVRMAHGGLPIEVSRRQSVPTANDLPDALATARAHQLVQRHHPADSAPPSNAKYEHSLEPSAAVVGPDGLPTNNKLGAHDNILIGHTKGYERSVPAHAIAPLALNQPGQPVQIGRLERHATSVPPLGDTTSPVRDVDESLVDLPPNQEIEVEPGVSFSEREPRRVTMAQFARERGVSDLDHSTLSPNGRVSGRQRDLTDQRAADNLNLFVQAQKEYQDAIDRGEIIGDYQPTQRTPEAEKLLEQARREREYAKMAGGTQAKKLIKRAEALEAQAAALQSTDAPGHVSFSERQDPSRFRNEATSALPANTPREAIDMVESLQKQLRTDELTQIGNRKHWNELIASSDERDSFMFIDLKKFKPINDQYGHAAGDMVLRHTADVMNRHFGPDSARYGGDEFGAVLRETDLTMSQAKAGEVQAELARTIVEVTLPDGNKVEIRGIEAHIGVARDAEAADAAANAVAAESRKIPRGDDRRKGERRADQGIDGPLGQRREGDEGLRPGGGPLDDALLAQRSPDFKSTSTQALRRQLHAQAAKQRVDVAEQSPVRVGNYSIATPVLRELAEESAVLYRGLLNRVDGMVSRMATAAEEKVSFAGLTWDGHAHGYHLRNKVRWNDLAAYDHAVKVVGRKFAQATGAQRTKLIAEYMSRHAWRTLAHEVRHQTHHSHGPEHDRAIAQLVKALAHEKKDMRDAIVTELLATKTSGKKSAPLLDLLGERHKIVSSEWSRIDAEVDRSISGQLAGNVRGLDRGGARGRDAGPSTGGAAVPPRGQVGGARPGEGLGRGAGLDRGRPGVFGGGALAASERQQPTIDRDANLAKFMAGSKVVDSSGKPLVVYHGTNADFDTFRETKKKQKESGFFFSPDPTIASRYAGWDELFPADEIGGVKPVYLAIKNPLVVDFHGDKHGRGEAIQRAKAAGHDGLHIKNHYDAGGIQDQWVAFYPEQIKSATGNVGTFDPTNPDIRFATRAPNPPESPDSSPSRPIRPIPMRPAGEKYGQPSGDPDIGQNLNRANITDRQKAVAEDVLKDEQSGLDREETETWESLDPRIAEIQRTMSDEQLYGLVEKRSLDAAEVQALKQRFDDKARKLDEARETGDPKKYMEKVFDFVAAGRALANDGTGTARALAARRRIMEAKETDNERFLKTVFREIPDVTDEQAAQLLKAYQTDKSALPELIGAAMKPGLMSKFLYLWRAGLISAVSSHVANVSGGAVEKGANVFETALSAGIDRILQGRFGGERQRFLAEAKAELRGVAKAFPNALKTLGQDLSDTVIKGKAAEFDPDKPLAHQMQPFQSKVGKAAGSLAKRVYNALAVEDKFTRAIGSSSELWKQALRKAGGDEKLAERIVHEALTEGKHTDVIETAKMAGTKLALQEDPGALVKKLEQMSRENTWLGIVFPFIRTPANIARRTIERSPYGFIQAKKAYDSFKRGEISRGEAADAIARPMLGTMILGGFTLAAKAGLMTGSGPTDEKDKAALRDSGWQPYSFKIPLGNGKHGFLPYNRFEPVSSILGFAADLAEINDERKAGDMLDKALGSLASNLTSKSYLQGLSDAASAIANPQQFMGTYAANLAGSLVPNIVNRANQAIDPTLRDTKPESTGLAGIPERMAKSIQSRIPGLAQSLPERKTFSGETVERGGDPISRFVMPATYSTTKEGRELEEFVAEYGITPSRASRDITVRRNGKAIKVRLTDEEYELIAKADQRAAEYARRLIRNPSFRHLPDTIEEGGSNSKEAALKRVFDRLREEARKRAGQRAIRRVRAEARSV